MYRIELIKPEKEGRKTGRIPVRTPTPLIKRAMAKNWCKNHKSQLDHGDYYVIVHPDGKREAV